MIHTVEGKMSAEGLRVALVVTRFNSFITEQLLLGALDALRRHGAQDKDIEIIRVPGAFELPQVARRLAMSGDFDALVALGAVIRGGTPHFDIIASEVGKGMAHIALDAPCAVSFGVLTTDNVEQAIERAGTKAGNKGAEATLAAIETANVLRQISIKD
ncbi:MAG: 6,7-dimethyl-8-ribityllumazine synthase [Myxococcales bacterium]|jgi:6,7-dimethyl-8-ribityllumazine synthase|nr:6,7-dimethyl-8-ribityllumazine synthase [Myxococcales bacterium]